MHGVILVVATLLTPSTGRHLLMSDRLEGEWRLASWIQNGVAQPLPLQVATSPNRWVIRNGIMTLYHDDARLVGDLKIEIDENAEPKTFSVTYVGDDEALKRSYQGGRRGICKFEGDTWTRCKYFDGKLFPEKFESPANSSLHLQVLKRVAAK